MIKLVPRNSTLESLAEVLDQIACSRLFTV